MTKIMAMNYIPIAGKKRRCRKVQKMVNTRFCPKKSLYTARVVDGCFQKIITHTQQTFQVNGGFQDIPMQTRTIFEPVRANSF
jgi:hypothetical protein